MSCMEYKVVGWISRLPLRIGKPRREAFRGAGSAVNLGEQVTRRVAAKCLDFRLAQGSMPA